MQWSWIIAGILGSLASIVCVIYLMVKPLRLIWLLPLSEKIDRNVKWLGNAAQLASALIALVGFTVVIYQIAASREKAARDAMRADLGDARRLYITYSEATLRYPELTSPDYDVLAHNHVEYIRYQNFVIHMIYAYDDMLNAAIKYESADDAAAWEASFRHDVVPHRRYLCYAGADFYAQYRFVMAERIQKIVAPCDKIVPIVERSADPGIAGPG